MMLVKWNERNQDLKKLVVAHSGQNDSFGHCVEKGRKNTCFSVRGEQRSVENRGFSKNTKVFCNGPSVKEKRPGKPGVFFVAFIDFSIKIQYKEKTVL